MPNWAPPSPPPPALRPSPWDIIRQGEHVLPPHKVWSHDLIPSHQNEHFHPISWRPLGHRRLAWHKWLFGIQSRAGFSHYATFWRDENEKTPCAACGTHHNRSVHGVLAHCSPTHPLVSAWLSAWSVSALVATWRATAVRRDLRIIARLAVPRSVYRYLAQHSGGLRAARKIVGQFQSTVVDSVNSALCSAIPPPSRRPCPFRPEDWR